MARHGENIRKRADGRWEGRYRAYSGEKNKEVYRSVYGNSYAEVKEKRMKIAAGISAAVLTRPQEAENKPQQVPDFNTVAAEWMQADTRNCKHSTCIKYAAVYNKYLAGTIGMCRITEISDSLLKENLSGSLSDSLLKSIYCVVNQILLYAEEHYSLCIPKLKMNIPKQKKKPVEVLDRREQEKLLSCLYHDMDTGKLAVILCICTGLRLGEVCALKWTDIDFKNRIMKVNRTVQRISAVNASRKTVLLETLPKSECSRREIPISKNLAEMLFEFQNNQDYVFGGNKPMEPRTLQYRFKRHLQEAQLPGRNFHILRHTFATNCIESGADVKSLSEILGHSDVRTTLSRYVHPSMDTKRKSLNVLWNFYGQFVGQTD